MNGVWLALRLTGIALGIITLLGFASGYLGVEFKPYFKNVLDWLERHLVDFIVRPEEIEWALDYLRQHFVWVPRPEPHWKPIYTMLALLTLSHARHGMPWYAIPLALIFSLVTAVYSGTVGMNTAEVQTFALVSFTLFLSAFVLFGRDLRNEVPVLAIAVASCLLGYIFPGSLADQLFGILVFVLVIAVLGGQWRALIGVLGYFAIAYLLGRSLDPDIVVAGLIPLLIALILMQRKWHGAFVGLGVTVTLAALGYLNSETINVSYIIAAAIAFLAIILVLDERVWEIILGLATAVVSFTFGYGVTISNSSELSPLLTIAIGVGVWGIVITLTGVIRNSGALRHRIQQPATATGLDILATLGGALALGYLFAA